ncbi:hypothetical protein BDZ94DRAFT_1306191 [Collybia nuda]|uniref:Transmembrane protein n=1 Tax=Collybia nuda TaxID=64659 RepID=A0A9P5YD09_9AGAR|nr:hypothetical protein BDZ94DRAFT_1306191 [Collybia nuda]
MQASESMLFPNKGMQVLAWLIHYLGIALITHCLSRRVATEDLTSWQGLSDITWPRALVLLVFLDSWLFVFASGVLVFGVGLELNGAICSAGIYLCIGCYATSKLLIYAFLIEKVHIVWSPTAGIPRFKSRVYVVCFITVALYLVIIALLLVGRTHYLRDGDQACVIGLKPFSSIPLLSYDLYVNVFLTALFLWPLFRSRMISPPVRKVAMRTLLAATVALTTSTVNMTVLTILKGKELGWVCLGSCAADVIVNALALFWVTGGGESRSWVTSSANAPRNSDRRHTTAKPPGALILGPPDSGKPGTLSHQQSPAYGYFPTTSYANSTCQNPHANTRGDLEPEPRVSSPFKQPKNKFTSLKDRLFRKDRNFVEEHGLQITVTTELDLEDQPTEAYSMQDDVYNESPKK